MAAIPEFQRRRLASQLVGTPGVNLAGAALGEAVAGFAGGLSEGIFRQVAAEQQAQRQAAQKVQDNVDVTRAKLASAQAGSQIRELGAQMQGRPMKEYQEGVNAIVTSFFKDEDTSLFRKQFSTDVLSHINSGGKQFFEKSQRTKLSQIKANLDGSIEESANVISSDFSDPELPFFDKIDSLFIQSDVNASTIEDAVAAGSLTAEEGRKAKEAANFQLAEAALRTTLEFFPEDVEDLLDSEDFREALALDEKEASELKKQAKDHIDRKTALTKSILLKKQFDTGVEFSKALMSTETPDPTEEDIQKALVAGDINKEQAKTFRDYKRSKKVKRFLGDNPETFGILQAEFESLEDIFFDEDGNELSGDDLADAELENEYFVRASQFQQKVMESMAAGTITKSAGQKFLREITPDVNRNLKDVFDSMNQLTTVRNWYKSNLDGFKLPQVEADRFAMEFQLQFMDQIDKRQKADNVTTLDFPTIKTIFNGLRAEFVDKINKNSGAFELNKIYEDENGRFKVIGFLTDGTPLIDETLEAAVLTPEEIKAAEKLRK